MAVRAWQTVGALIGALLLAVLVTGIQLQPMGAGSVPLPPVEKPSTGQTDPAPTSGTNSQLPSCEEPPAGWRGPCLYPDDDTIRYFPSMADFYSTIGQ